MYNGIAVTVVF